MYNLKKQAQIKPTEKMLQEQNKFYGVSQTGDAVITDKQLKDDRKDPQGDKIGEKQLKDVRNASDSIITEKQLNVGTGSSIDTRGDKGVVLMDMPLEAASKAQKDFDKENKGNLSAENKAFWDALVEGGSKKIKNNVQGSQLLSNYDSREDFNKSNPSFDKKASLLSDADAMLYHVYKQAASMGRELTTDEQLIVNSINANKMRILADHKADIAADKEHRTDTFDMEGDDLEDELQEEKDFEQYKKDHPNEFVS